jgi:hypothetical protein
MIQLHHLTQFLEMLILLSESLDVSISIFVLENVSCSIIIVQNPNYFAKRGQFAFARRFGRGTDYPIKVMREATLETSLSNVA